MFACHNIYKLYHKKRIIIASVPTPYSLNPITPYHVHCHFKLKLLNLNMLALVITVYIGGLVKVSTTIMVAQESQCSTKIQGCLSDIIVQRRRTNLYHEINSTMTCLIEH